MIRGELRASLARPDREFEEFGHVFDLIVRFRREPPDELVLDPDLCEGEVATVLDTLHRLGPTTRIWMWGPARREVRTGARLEHAPPVSDCARLF